MNASDFINRLFDTLAAQDPEGRLSLFRDMISDDRTWPAALAAFGKDAVPALMDQARQGRRFRLLAIHALGLLGSDAAQAVPLLLNTLTEQEQHLGRLVCSSAAAAAAQALGHIRMRQILSETARILEIGPAHAKPLAAEVCAAFGDEAKEVVPILRSLLQQAEGDAAESYDEALRTLGAQ
jgi:hypothetical protein